MRRASLPLEEQARVVGEGEGLQLLHPHVQDALDPLQLADTVVRLLRDTGGIYVSHMRDEANFVLDSIDETVRIGEGSGSTNVLTSSGVDEAFTTGAQLGEGRGRAVLDDHHARRGRGAVVRRAILDKDVVVPEGAHIGLEPDLDRARYHVSEGGIVVKATGKNVDGSN